MRKLWVVAVANLAVIGLVLAAILFNLASACNGPGGCGSAPPYIYIGVAVVVASCVGLGFLIRAWRRGGGKSDAVVINIPVDEETPRKSKRNRAEAPSRAEQRAADAAVESSSRNRLGRIRAPSDSGVDLGAPNINLDDRTGDAASVIDANSNDVLPDTATGLVRLPLSGDYMHRADSTEETKAVDGVDLAGDISWPTAAPLPVSAERAPVMPQVDGQHDGPDIKGDVEWPVDDECDRDDSMTGFSSANTRPIDWQSYQTDAPAVAEQRVSLPKVPEITLPLGAAPSDTGSLDAEPLGDGPPLPEEVAIALPLAAAITLPLVSAIAPTDDHDGYSIVPATSRPTPWQFEAETDPPVGQHNMASILPNPATFTDCAPIGFPASVGDLRDIIEALSLDILLDRQATGDIAAWQAVLAPLDSGDVVGVEDCDAFTQWVDALADRHNADLARIIGRAMHHGDTSGDGPMRSAA